MKLFEYVLGKSISDVTSNITTQICDLLKSKLIYFVDISRLCQFYDYRVFKDLFKNIPISPHESGTPLSYWDAIRSGTSSYDIITYKGSKIVFGFIRKIDSINIVLMTLNTDKDRHNLDSFIEYLKKRAKKLGNFDPSVYAILHGDRPDYYSGKQQRTFQDVFIPNDVYSDLNKSISDFVKNKKWYKDHNIPYHFGILLYGPPGTGKSTLISAISNKYKAVPFYLKAGRLSGLDDCKSDISNMLNITDNIKLFVVEDIDSCKYFTRSRFDYMDIVQYSASDNNMAKREAEKLQKRDEAEKFERLSSFLNIMDGNACFENVIWIFTTNYIDELEPSLIRSGRIDRKFYIGYATNETFNQFMLYHFKKPIPDSLKIRQDVSFADVQTDVMSGLSYDNIVNKYMIVDLNKI
jgi:SpoVK/Ycf46/Vps4 family AAA+-type ATPase